MESRRQPRSHLKEDMLKRARYQRGSAAFDKRRKSGITCTAKAESDTQWRLAHYAAIPRRRPHGTISKTSKRKIQPSSIAVPTVNMLVEQYRPEKMPKRHSTRLGYESWITNHILPRWDDFPITDSTSKARRAGWRSSRISPKSRVHIRGLISGFWDYAMWRGEIPTGATQCNSLPSRGDQTNSETAQSDRGRVSGVHRTSG